MEPFFKWALRKFVRFMAWSSLVFSFAMFAALANDIKVGGPNISGGITACVFFAATTAALMRAGYRKKKGVQPAVTVMQPQQVASASTPLRSLRDDVLVCAETHDWRLTITDVATDLNLSFGEARDALEQLLKADDCTSETIDGRVVYDFAAHKKRVAARSLQRS